MDLFTTYRQKYINMSGVMRYHTCILLGLKYIWNLKSSQEAFHNSRRCSQYSEILGDTILKSKNRLISV